MNNEGALLKGHTVKWRNIFTKWRLRSQPILIPLSLGYKIKASPEISFYFHSWTLQPRRAFLLKAIHKTSDQNDVINGDKNVLLVSLLCYLHCCFVNSLIFLPSQGVFCRVRFSMLKKKGKFPFANRIDGALLLH